jgi:hypothetical protein
MYKENNTKNKNIKKLFIAHCAKISPTKKELVHSLTHMSTNSCAVTNINIYKYRVN